MQNNKWFSRIIFILSTFALIAQLIIPSGAAKAVGENIWWCANTDTPGSASCISSANFDNTFKTALKTKSGVGILYLAKTYTGGNISIIQDVSNFENLTDLTIQGGWDVSSLNGNSVVSGSYTRIIWMHSVTVNNIDLSNTTGMDFAFEIRTDTATDASDITINNVNVKKALTSYGAVRIQNSLSGSVTVKNSIVGGTADDGSLNVGISIETGTGAVTVDNVESSYNQKRGLTITGDIAGGLTIKNSTFHHNVEYGIYTNIFTGNTLLENVTASNNGTLVNGLGWNYVGENSTCEVTSCLAVTIKNSTFNENGDYGIYLKSYAGKQADITLENVIVNKNTQYGAWLENYRDSGSGNILVKTSTFGTATGTLDGQGNGGSGLSLKTNGTTEINDTKVNNNNFSKGDYPGLEIFHMTTHITDVMDITMDKGAYNYNYGVGIWLTGSEGDSFAKLTNMEIGNNTGKGIRDSQGGELSLGDCDFNYHDNLDPNTDYFTPSAISYVDAPITGDCGGGGGGDPTPTPAPAAKSKALPATGFAPSVVTKLPQQTAEKAYAKMSGLWLEIPSQKVLTQIVGVPEVTGNWDVTWLGKDIGWLNGTAFPTWVGNSVVTAHVTDANGKAGPFAGISNLSYGEKIVVHLYGGKYTFEVRESRLVFPSMVDYALKHLEDHSYLTLITCQGYNFLTNNYIFRHVVRAVLISVTPE